jgi:hypothetical protein
MKYDNIIFENYRLRKMGVREISADTERLLKIETDQRTFDIEISTYEKTREELDRMLSRLVDDTWKIGKILDYFDDVWDKINEFVNKPTVKGDDRAQ